MISYAQIITKLRGTADNLVSVNSTAFGTLDKLDNQQHNILYPYVFFRPLTSDGIGFSNDNINGNGRGERIISLEMYVMDIPKQTDEDYLEAISQCELIGYNIITDYVDGDGYDDFEVELRNIVPLQEAFKDRVVGWLFNIDIITNATQITNCNAI